MRSLIFALLALIFGLSLLACATNESVTDPALVGVWNDASLRPITLILHDNGDCVYIDTANNKNVRGTFDVDGGLIRYLWDTGAVISAPYQITDGVDTLVTFAWDEILTMVRQ